MGRQWRVAWYMFGRCPPVRKGTAILSCWQSKNRMGQGKGLPASRAQCCTTHVHQHSMLGNDLHFHGGMVQGLICIIALQVHNSAAESQPAGPQVLLKPWQSATWASTPGGRLALQGN